MKHELKTWPQYFCRVIDGTKTFQVRDNDRGFQPGDIVVLKEWDPAQIKESDEAGSYTRTKGYTGDFATFKIGYVFPLPHDKVVFSLLEESPAKTVSEK